MKLNINWYILACGGVIKVGPGVIVRTGIRCGRTEWWLEV